MGQVKQKRGKPPLASPPVLDETDLDVNANAEEEIDRVFGPARQAMGRRRRLASLDAEYDASVINDTTPSMEAVLAPTLPVGTPPERPTMPEEDPDSEPSAPEPEPEPAPDPSFATGANLELLV